MPLKYIIQREMVDHGLHTGKVSHYEVDDASNSKVARRMAAAKLAARYNRGKESANDAILGY